MHSLAFLLCKRLHKLPVGRMISPIHYYIYKGDSGYRRDEKMLHSAKIVLLSYSYLHFALDFTTFQDKKKVNQNIPQHQDTRHKP